MKKLSASKKKKLLSAIKKYRKKYLIGKYSEVDEAATRLMVNDFLTLVLGFVGLDEIKTEYMIRGTYADYVIQIKGKRYFIIEAKAMPIELSQKHLRQAVNYAANEGIEWVLLTNGRQFEFYRVLFEKPIDSRKIFSLDLADESAFKKSVSYLQFLTRGMVKKRGLEALWNRCCALDPLNVSNLFYSDRIINFIRRQLKKSHRSSFDREDIVAAVTRVIEDKIENVSPSKRGRRKSRKKVRSQQKEKLELVSSNPAPIESVEFRKA